MPRQFRWPQSIADLPQDYQSRAWANYYRLMARNTKLLNVSDIEALYSVLDQDPKGKARYNAEVFATLSPRVRMEYRKSEAGWLIESGMDFSKIAKRLGRSIEWVDAVSKLDASQQDRPDMRRYNGHKSPKKRS